MTDSADEASGGAPDEKKGRYPKGFDPARDTLLDASSLRGIAHPLRPQILGLLRAEGPSTATRVAERLGLSSAATSYHLRQLAAYGFITEDKDRGTTRERWWRAVHDRTWFDQTLAEARAEAEGDADVGEVNVLAHDYLSYIVDTYAQKLHRWLDYRHTLGPEWTDGSTMSDSLLRLTAEESERLHQELKQVVDRYRAPQDTEAPAGARLVAAQYQVFPWLLPGDTGEERRASGGGASGADGEGASQ